MSTPTATPGGQPPRSFGVGRVLSLVFGSLALLVALALFAGGGAALWAMSQRDGSGYITSARHRLSTPTYALVSESFDVGTDAPGWSFNDHFGTVRIQAGSPRPVFIGIGRTSDVEQYLAGVRRDQIANLNVDPFSVSYRRSGGGARPAAPAAESFWRVKASGPGAQTISWPLEKGNWSAVAMNAAGAPGVTVDTRFGARLPFLRWVAIGFFAGGGLALLIGSLLVYLGVRRPPAVAPVG